ncbi:MAG: phasin family protein [Magnetococcales bacterium]|nr:phasin family protein [Magnetococcales bacterium]
MDNKKVAKQVNDMTKAVLDSMIRLQEINDRTVQQLAKRQLEAASDFMDSGVKQLRVLGSVQDLGDMVGKQADLAKELNDKMLTHAKQTMDLLMSTKVELNEIMEKNLNTISASLVKNANEAAGEG